MPESNPSSGTSSTITNPIVKQNDLTNFNTRSKTWVKNQIATSITAIGTILKLKNRVDTYDDLPTDAVPGDMYMVGTDESSECKEYFRTSNNTWQFCGVTAPSLEGYITETQLYKGVSGTGTIDEPAEGTLLAAFDADLDAAISDIADIKAELNATISDATLDAMFVET